MSGEVISDTRNSSPGVVEDWENDNDPAQIDKQLEDRFKKVRILQREKADREAQIEKAKAEQEVKNSNAAAEAMASATAGGSTPKFQLMRRPKSDEKMASQAELARRVEAERCRKGKTLEERQAAYDEARVRILGSDYKPDTAAAVVPMVDRSKSPETISLRGPVGPPHELMRMQPVSGYPSGFMPLPNQGYNAMMPVRVPDTSVPPPSFPMMMSNAGQNAPSNGGPQPFYPQVPFGCPPSTIFPPNSLAHLTAPPPLVSQNSQMQPNKMSSAAVGAAATPSASTTQSKSTSSNRKKNKKKNQATKNNS